MDDVESLNHSKWECKYHVVFIPKYRRKHLYGQLRQDLREVFRRLAMQKKSRIEEGHLMPDHVHMLVSIPPKYAVSQVIGYIKGKSAIHIARTYFDRKRNYVGHHFWARGYFVSTVGRDEAAIREYIRKQEREDKLRLAMEAGADDYLFKPFRPSELALRIRARLRHRHSSWRPEEQEALLDLTRMLASSLDMKDLLHLVAVRTAEVLHVDRCSFVLIYPEGARARVVAASESAALGGIEVSLENYPEIREVIRTQRPFVVDRVEDHPTLKGILPTLVKKGVGSLALFPMIHEGRVDGVLFLRSERFRHVLGERDIFFASAVAAAVALSLRNLQAVERERQIASELQRTKQFMENLIDSSVDAIVAADMKGNIILFNKGAERIFGYSSEEVIGKLHVTSLYPSGMASIPFLSRLLIT